MGLRKESVFLLMQEGLRNPFHGKIVTLGKQDVWATFEEIERLAKEHNYPIQPVSNIELSEKAELRDQGFISDRTLFKLLGFKEIISMDASKYENADLLYDLNLDCLPPELKEAFDVVLDPGTIEHVFHVPNSLKNIFNLLQVGGRVIHISPSSNHIDHGFYMFSPTLFSDYYTANRFDLQPLKIIRYKPQPVYPWGIATYSPGEFNSFSFGGLDDAMYAVCCIAGKNDHSTSNQIPQQHNFIQNLWKQKEFSFGNSKIKSWVKSSPLFYKFCLPLLRFYKRANLRRKFKSLV